MDYYYEFSAGATAMIVIFAVIILIVEAFFMTEVGEEKGYSDQKTKIFLLCFFLGVIGAIYVVAFPDKKTMAQRAQIIQLLGSLRDTDNVSIVKDEKGNIKKIHALDSSKDDHLQSFTSNGEDDLPTL